MAYVKVEIPDFYLHETCESGSKFMEMYGSIIPGAADRFIFASNIVNKYSGKELVQFIAEILLAYDAQRFTYTSADKDGIVHTGI